VSDENVPTVKSWKYKIYQQIRVKNITTCYLHFCMQCIVT